MLDLKEDIQSLSDFKRRTPEHIQRIKATGKPLVLTVNGRAEVVVQDAAAYQKLLEQVERLEAVAAVREAEAEFQRGEGQPVREALGALRRKHAIPG